MTASTVQPQNPALDFTGSKLRLKDILKTLPRESFQRNMRKAWTMVLVNVLRVGLG